MRILIGIMLYVVFFLYVAHTQITIRPFSISMPYWYRPVAITLIVIAMALYNIGEHSIAYKKGLKRGSEITLETLKEIEAKKKLPMKTRNEFPDWFTEHQWLQKGYVVKRNHLGQELWCNNNYQNSATYFAKKDVRKDELKAKEILKERNKEARERYKKKKIAMEKELELHEVWNTEYQWLQLGRKPNADAVWKSGESLNHYYLQFGSNYYYCHLSDTHPINNNEENK